MGIEIFLLFCYILKAIYKKIDEILATDWIEVVSQTWWVLYWN